MTEIDEIFSKKRKRNESKEAKGNEKVKDEGKKKDKVKKAAAKNTEKSGAVEKPKRKIKTSDMKEPLINNSIALSDDQYQNKNSEGRRLTEEGYPIYAIEELISSKGGDTDLCPFDCECCF